MIALEHPPALERLDDAICKTVLALSPRADTITLALPGGLWESFPLANPALSPVQWRREPCEQGFQSVRFRSFGTAAMGEHFHEYPEHLRQIRGSLTLRHNGEVKTLREGDEHTSNAGEIHSAQYGPDGGETVCKWTLDAEVVVCKVFG